MPRTPAEVLRVEVILCVACAVLGGVFQAGGHTLHAMSIFLFGWSAGIVLHLVTRALRGRRVRGRRTP